MNIVPRLLLVTFLFGLVMSKSIAQSSQINCDPVFDPLVTQDVLATSFEGSIVFSGSVNNAMRLTFLDGQTRVERSELRAIVPSGYYAKLSPDGRYIVSLSRNDPASLIVWDIATDESTFISLTEEELTALNEQDSRPQDINLYYNEQRLEWVSPTEFVLRRLDLPSRIGPIFLFQQSFAFAESPLGIVRGERIDFLKGLPVIPDSPSTYNFYSSSGKHLLQFGYSQLVDPLFTLIQVIDLDTLETLITLMPTGDLEYSANYLWTKDEQTLIVKERRRDPLTDITLTVLHQIDFRISPPQLNTQMWDDIEAAFGGQVQVSNSLSRPTLSPSGDKIAFKVWRVGDYFTDYLVSYDLTTRQVVAVCDNQRPESNFIQTFWSPDERYVGYFDDTRHVLVVMDTQEAAIYSLPLTENDQQFLGWVP